MQDYPGVLRKMFNLAEVWGYRPDGTNPCRHVPMFPPGEETRLIVDDELALIFRHLEKLEAEGLENYVIPLAIRLQFEFASRRSEICTLEWRGTEELTMSQDDTPDLATPQAGKVAPEAVALRAQPRAVTRLKRRTLAMLVGGLSVAVLGATIWSLQPQRRGAGGLAG